MVLDQTLPLSFLRGILHRQNFDYGIRHKDDTYVEVVVKFVRESLEMKDLPARPGFVKYSTKILKTPPSLFMSNLMCSFKCGQFASIIPNYLK